MRRKHLSFKQEQSQLDSLRVFYSDVWLIISSLNIHNSVKYLLNICFPNQKGLYRLFLVPWFIVSLFWIQVDCVIALQLPTHFPCSPSVCSISVYESSIERLIPLPSNTFKYGKMIGFCFLFLLLTPGNIYISIRDGLLLPTYLRVFIHSVEFKIKVHGRNLQKMRLER